MGCCNSSEDKPKSANPPKKERVSERRKLLLTGKAGSLGIGLDSDMTITKASDTSGLKTGDLVVMVKTTEDDDDFDDNDKVNTAVRDRKEFMTASGPRRDVFEGCTLPVTIIRDPAKQRAFREKARGLSEKDWVKEVQKEEHGAETIDIVIQPETDGVRNTRKKKITKIKEEKGLDKMDVDLVINIMSDPAAAKSYAQTVFQKADADGTKTLNGDEVTQVFIELAEHIGCKVPSKGDIKDLSKYMDVNKSGHITFSEFFPVFRWKMINLVSDMLEED